MSYNVPNVKFNDGRSIPQLGYGVWQVEDEVAEKVVATALEIGYRHIDTAAIYGNEAGVGRAIANSNVAREDIFLTTKLWNSDQGYESAFEAFEASLEKLGTDYVDLYLIHWAKPQQGLYLDSWRALIELQKQGKVRSVATCCRTPYWLRSRSATAQPPRRSCWRGTWLRAPWLSRSL